MPVTWKDAARYAPRPAARPSGEPTAIKHAARNAGVQTHIPSSSYAWKV